MVPSCPRRVFWAKRMEIHNLVTLILPILKTKCLHDLTFREDGQHCEDAAVPPPPLHPVVPLHLNSLLWGTVHCVKYCREDGQCGEDAAVPSHPLHPAIPLHLHSLLWGTVHFVKYRDTEQFLFEFHLLYSLLQKVLLKSRQKIQQISQLFLPFKSPKIVKYIASLLKNWYMLFWLSYTFAVISASQEKHFVYINFFLLRKAATVSRVRSRFSIKIPICKKYLIWKIVHLFTAKNSEIRRKGWYI